MCLKKQLLLPDWRTEFTLLSLVYRQTSSKSPIQLAFGYFLYSRLSILIEDKYLLLVVYCCGMLMMA